MAHFCRAVALCAAVAGLAGCHVSVSAGGPDYPKLESAIADELNNEYSALSRRVSSVDCPPPDQQPKAGDTLTCIADLDGSPVRVKATFTDDDGNVDFATVDTVYDLADTAAGLAKEVSSQYGFDVTVDCGAGIKVVESGKVFECAATDPRGDTRTVRVTAGAAGKQDKWEVVD